jgi:hypothetical protein
MATPHTGMGYYAPLFPLMQSVDFKMTSSVLADGQMCLIQISNPTACTLSPVHTTLFIGRDDVRKRPSEEKQHY